MTYSTFSTTITTATSLMVGVMNCLAWPPAALLSALKVILNTDQFIMLMRKILLLFNHFMFSRSKNYRTLIVELRNHKRNRPERTYGLRLVMVIKRLIDGDFVLNLNVWKRFQKKLVLDPIILSLRL